MIRAPVTITIVTTIDGQSRTATAGQETVRTVCTTRTVAVAVAVAAGVTVAVAVEVAAAVAGGHCPTPPLLPRVLLLRVLPPAPAPAASTPPLACTRPPPPGSQTLPRSTLAYADGRFRTMIVGWQRRCIVCTTDTVTVVHAVAVVVTVAVAVAVAAAVAGGA